MSIQRQRAAIQVPQVAPKQGVRWAFARGAEVEGQDGVPGRRAASAVPPFVRTVEPNYLLSTKLDLNGALQRVLAQAGELLLVFDHR